MALDRIYRAKLAGQSRVTTADRQPTRVLYVSPLKALAVDIEVNLMGPLREIAEIARELGQVEPDIKVGVRSGDTSPAQRAAMVKSPPDILITTPESLYLMLTAAKGRETLRGVETVIVDEIHALARDKRGAHLALSLARLDRLVKGSPVQKIGLSATQKPVEDIAKFLVGSRELPVIVECGYHKSLNVRLELPQLELGPIFTEQHLVETLKSLEALIDRHHTTLIFVNTRRMAERLAHRLSELICESKEDQVLGHENGHEKPGTNRTIDSRSSSGATVAAHHGSLSKERRQLVESNLRSGKLKALVATASLELGIDIGPVDLVCQVGSPRSIATFLQRVGRSNHRLSGTPRAVLFPTTLDELVECTALAFSLSRGLLDSIEIPRAPLDILAQQIVAEVSSCAPDPTSPGYPQDDLFELVRQTFSYANLSREDFDRVVDMLSDGIPTGRGQRGAHLHRDSINQVLRGRKGARLHALTNPGAIPESGDYRVVLDGDDTFLGSINEDFAIESMVGDVFLLGTHSWRITQVTNGQVRVVDGNGAHPNLPFWLGEAPARTRELSEVVSDLRQGYESLAKSPDMPTGSMEPASGESPSHENSTTLAWITEKYGLEPYAAQQLDRYLGTGLAQLGALGTKDRLVLERFFDETGGMQLVVHCPLGGRVNRALGLALRKRFCVTFDFELQAAANDDCVVLSLGPQHSFPLSRVPRLLNSNTVRQVLIQAVLLSPMFATRWRWNLTRSLIVLRNRVSSPNPLPLQRLESNDLMASVFPALAACQENTPGGPIEIPDHVLVRQTIHDCLTEAMDVDSLEKLVSDLENGALKTVFVDASEPSVLSQEILGSRPYTFLDDAPLEERRTRLVSQPGTLDRPGYRVPPVQAIDMSDISTQVLELVERAVSPNPEGPEELHDLMLRAFLVKSRPEWTGWFDQLASTGRAIELAEEVDGELVKHWVATERVETVKAGLYGTNEDSLAPVLRGILEYRLPVTLDELARTIPVSRAAITTAMAQLESEGFAMALGERWASRGVCARIRRVTSETKSTRKSIAFPTRTKFEYLRFLLDFQHLGKSSSLTGRVGLTEVIGQLQGCHAPVSSWEDVIFPALIRDYKRELLDHLCLSGTVSWARLGGPQPGIDQARGHRASAGSKATPITFFLRQDYPWLAASMSHSQLGFPGFQDRGQLQDIYGPEQDQETDHANYLVGSAREIFDLLTQYGAMFYSDLVEVSRRLPEDIDKGLWELLASSLITSDSFESVRALLGGRSRHHRYHRGRQLPTTPWARNHLETNFQQGRWTLVQKSPLVALSTLQRGAHQRESITTEDLDTLSERVAEAILVRWGIFFYDIWNVENFRIPWKAMISAFRRLELRGVVVGGRFVSGVRGEQFALPRALEYFSSISSYPDTYEFSGHIADFPWLRRFCQVTNLNYTDRNILSRQDTLGSAIASK